MVAIKESTLEELRRIIREQGELIDRLQATLDRSITNAKNSIDLARDVIEKREAERGLR